MLLLSIVGGQAGPITENTSEKDLPKQQTITLRADRIKRVLGIAIEAAQVEDQLTRLGLTVEPTEQGWQVTIPSFRFDLAIEVDLIEELGRLYGYDLLPNTRPQGTVLTTNISEHTIATERLQDLLVDRGYQEAITYSFVDPTIHQHFLLEDMKPITLMNPISADLSEMRTSLWPGLIQALVYNLNRQHERVRLFEVGRIYTGTTDNIDQHRQIGGMVCGSRYDEQWSEKQPPVDFLDVKADVEQLLAFAGGEIEFIAEQHSSLHPGQSARIYKAGKPIGWIGALHPRLNKPLGFDGKVYAFEFALTAALSAQVPSFEPLSRFPAIRRDLALLVDANNTVGEIQRCLNGIESDILKAIQLFDVYSGDRVELGKKSIAIAFHMQHGERTLTDEEVDALIDLITQTLEKALGAVIRT